MSDIYEVAKTDRAALKNAVSAAEYVVSLCERNIAAGESPNPNVKADWPSTVAHCYAAMTFITQARAALADPLPEEIVEALPVKNISDGMGYQGIPNPNYIGWCPRLGCGSVVTSLHAYCQQCGQRLGWAKATSQEADPLPEPELEYCHVLVFEDGFEKRLERVFETEDQAKMVAATSIYPKSVYIRIESRTKAGPWKPKEQV
jgi:hypothetical protein